jgi:hypothetical protein
MYGFQNVFQQQFLRTIITLDTPKTLEDYGFGKWGGTP